jgi:hypothetical protein
MKMRPNSLSIAIIAASLCLSTPLALAESVLTAPAKPKSPSATNTIAQPDLAKCAPGFNKVHEVRSPLGAVTSFECRTPVIHCPHHPAASQVSLEGEVDANSNQNPDISALTLSYSCTYYTPEG